MTTETVVKRGPGRPRKNPEAAAPTAPAKRRPGRPKGSKNKPKTTAATAPASAPVTKRGPGRPKGSKNKPKTTATVATATAPVVKRGPGRPRKNPVDVLIPAKRGPGRPKGSKNKPKTTTETPATVTTATAPVAKRGPGRPRKNPVVQGTGTTATITSTSKTASKANSNTRQVLVNPFKAGDVVNIPAGSTFTSAAPSLKGRQKVKRGHKVTVVGIIPAHVQPRNSETGSKVLIRPTRIRAKGSGNYWKDITLTEKILKFNAMNATYETVNVEAAAESSATSGAETETTATSPVETAVQVEAESTASDHEPMFSANL